METLEFHYPNGHCLTRPRKPVLVGIVGSGNLEVLVESDEPGSGLRVHVKTAAVGFGPIWRAVLDDVLTKWQLADAQISVNDVGATPAVVALRMNQALSLFTGHPE